jgi:ribonuclease T2
VERLARALLASLAILAVSGAAGQGRREFRASPPGTFDYYILALSWSPTFCVFEGGARNEDQCAPGRRLGFVVHGLWPQLERGRLEDCGDFSRPPSRQALEEARGVFPSESLARHEWRRHGTCSGQSPAEYFRDVRRARERLRIPAAFQSPDPERRTSPRDVERAFVEANPGLRGDMIALACRRARLQEVRVCFEPDLRGFRACPRSGGGGCPPDGLVVTGSGSQP